MGGKVAFCFSGISFKWIILVPRDMISLSPSAFNFLVCSVYAINEFLSVLMWDVLLLLPILILICFASYLFHPFIGIPFDEKIVQEEHEIL